MDTNLTNYFEFLENSSKFKAMDKAARTKMLSQINELIKSEALWMRNSHKDESKRRISKALFARLYSDKKDDTVIKINYHDIKEWTVNNKQQGSNGIILILNDGRTIAKETFQINKAYNHLSKVMEEKESRVIELNKLRNEKITLENPFKSKKKK